ncbi:alpha/beta fold hydrolase [Actinacidiphila sp. ITFR-21]|uniref:thioesterase domain-containing protein n=1 Tax=Actinacidiphila sp. ITFR-21 TaxID=3075199 RepID=UPI00288BD1E1|nr:alpha/beta fold hydrolase [Streptomyces sp. ITFR-21]WNI18862.1 alpha/beta fold hydrolase [Streptomyces sp. ITFR-21]
MAEVALDLDRLVPLQPKGTRTPLYCVHAVSGSAYSYAGLARQLGDDQPLYGFEAPGFDNDRTPVSDLPALADEYTAILREAQPEGPYQLLGWSLGGLLAFEMAKRLTGAGARVAHLILVDAGLPEVMPLPPERDILLRFVRDMMGLSDSTPPELTGLFAPWPPDARPEAVFPAVEKSAILPEEFDADLLDQQYRVFRAHLEGFYSTRLQGPYDGPAVHVLAEFSAQEDMRWGRLLTDLREFGVTGATHHSIWTGDHLDTLAQIVRTELGAPSSRA